MAHLFRDGVWEPLAEMGQPLQLVSPRSSDFYRVEFIEPIPFLESSADRPGVLLRDFNANNLADSASVQVTPTELQMPRGELLQMRWTMFEAASGGGLVSAIAGVILNEIDVQVHQLQANRRWPTNNSFGIVNLAQLLPLPSAEEAAWSLGGSGTAMTASANINRLSGMPWRHLNLTELYVFEDDGPSFTVVNRSGAALDQGELRLAVSGFRHVLRAISEGEAHDLAQRYGLVVPIPVPVQGRTAAGNT